MLCFILTLPVKNQVYRDQVKVMGFEDERRLKYIVTLTKKGN